MTTQALLNKVAYPMLGQNVRRKFTPLYSTVDIATATTEYYPYTNISSVFTDNEKFPLSGQQIFAITNIGAVLSSVIDSQTNYEALLLLFQQSYLQIDVDSRTMLKIPMIEIMSYSIQDVLGDAGTAQTGAKTFFTNRSKQLIFPIVLNSQSNVNVKFVTNSTFTTAFNGETIRFTLNGVMLDKLDTISVNFLLNSNGGIKRFSQLAWTLWESKQITTVNQNTFTFFDGNTTNPALVNGVLPLSNTELFEIQALEIFFGGNYGTTDTPVAVRDNRNQNILRIEVENALFYQAPIQDFLSQASASVSNFQDAAGTSNIPLINVDVNYRQKVLEIPLILPATGNIKVTLEQPGSSLNSNQYATLMLKGKKTRQVI